MNDTLSIPLTRPEIQYLIWVLTSSEMYQWDALKDKLVAFLKENDNEPS